jgi:hypothetical protein
LLVIVTYCCRQSIGFHNFTHFAIRIAPKGLTNVHSSYQKSDFQFIVGEEHSPRSLFAAEFISPKVSRLRQADRTIPVYRLKTPDRHDHFSDLLLFGECHRIAIKPDGLKFIADAAPELENSELLFWACAYPWSAAIL